MKRYKALISLILAACLSVAALAPAAVFAETELVVGPDGDIIEVEVGSETGEAEDGAEADPEKAEDAVQNISELTEKPKLSGLDFVNIYDGSFLTISGYLKKFGIFKDEDSDAEHVLTRGEFAVLVARILNGKNDALQSAFRYEFKDVDETESYYNAVNQLCNYGIVQGDGNGYFYPDNDIKGAEALIILMNMMGYYEIAHMRGAGDAGYRNLALKMKFTKEVPLDYDSTVTLEKAARLIYHALHENVAESSSYSEGNLEFSQSDDTLMYRYMDVLTIDGVVTANEFTSLSDSGDKTDKNCIKIQDTVLRFDDESLVPYDYLGLYARVYYREDSGRNTAVFIEALNQKYNVLKINAKDIESFDKDKMTVYYTENKKAKSEEVPISISIIFNSAAVSSEIDSRYFTPDAGQLVFIDNNRDRQYDVLIIDSYSTYVAKGAFSGEDGNLYDDLGVQSSLCISDKNVKVYKNNQKTDYTAIAAGDVVLVAGERVSYAETEEPNPIVTYQKIDTSSENIRLIASDYTFSGNLSSISSDDYLYIDSIGYEYAKSFNAAAAVGNSNKAVKSGKIGVNVNGALDINGDIVWMRRGTDESIKYGYLVKASAGESSLKPSQAKIYTQDDEMIVVNFAQKVKVHRLWGSGSPDLKTYYPKTMSGNSITEDVPELLNRQIVKYKLNQGGELSEIFFAADDTGRDYMRSIPLLQEGIMYYCGNIHHSTSEKHYYISFGSDGVLTPLFVFRKSRSVGFIIPVDSSGNVVEEVKYYKAYSPTSKSSSPFTHAAPLTNVKVYDVDSAIIGAFVQEKKVTVSGDNTGVSFASTSSFIDAVVDKARLVYDTESDEYITELSAWNKGKLKNYKFLSSDIVSLENKTTAYLSKISASDLKKGDMVLLHQDALGAIDGFRVVHRPQYMLKNTAAEPYECEFDGSVRAASETNPFPTTKMFAAGEIVRMVGASPFVDTGREALRRMMMYGVSTVQVLIYDMSQDKIKAAINSSKNPTFADCEEGDYLFWYQYERYPMTVLAVRNYN